MKHGEASGISIDFPYLSHQSSNTMSWQQLYVTTDPQQEDTLSSWLMDHGALSITLADAEDQPILEPGPGETPLWSHITLIALFEAGTNLEEIQRQMAREWPAAADSCRLETLADRTWETAWMDEFHPMRFGDRLWICPSWCEPPDPTAVNILLDPGLAFGSGTHETTALCLEWLDRQSLAGARVLDYGCGSGILAIAAAKLGALEVVGTDTDPQAIIASRDNAARNGIPETQVNWLQVSADCCPDLKPVDVLVSNILAGPLRALAPSFAAYVRPGGSMALSGLLAEQADEINRLYATWFDMAEPVVKGDWALLQGKKRGS